mgnify:CR=1 FL=1
MKKRLTYTEFRMLRDNLPHGAIDIIANRLGITADEVSSEHSCKVEYRFFYCRRIK